MKGISRPSDIEYPWIAFCPIMFNHIFSKSWKDAVQWHGLDCYKDLQEHRFIRWNRICKKVSSRSNNYTSIDPYNTYYMNFFLHEGYCRSKKSYLNSYIQPRPNPKYTLWMKTIIHYNAYKCSRYIFKSSRLQLLVNFGGKKYSTHQTTDRRQMIDIISKFKSLFYSMILNQIILKWKIGI